MQHDACPLPELPIQVDLKTYHKDRMSSAELSTLRQRAFVLSRLSHPSIVKFYGAFEDNHNVYFVLESSQQVVPGPFLPACTSRGTASATERVTKSLNQFLKPSSGAGGHCRNSEAEGSRRYQ